MNKVLESWGLEYRSPESMLKDMVSPCVLQDGIENKMILEVSIQPARYTMWKPRPTNKSYFKQRRVSKDWEQRLSSDPKKHMVSWSCTYAYIHTDECTHIHTPTPPHTQMYIHRERKYGTNSLVEVVGDRMKWKIPIQIVSFFIYVINTKVKYFLLSDLITLCSDWVICTIMSLFSI